MEKFSDLWREASTFTLSIFLQFKSNFKFFTPFTVHNNFATIFANFCLVIVHLLAVQELFTEFKKLTWRLVGTELLNPCIPNF